MPASPPPPGPGPAGAGAGEPAGGAGGREGGARDAPGRGAHRKPDAAGALSRGRPSACTAPTPGGGPRGRGSREGPRARRAGGGAGAGAQRAGTPPRPGCGGGGGRRRDPRASDGTSPAFGPTVDFGPGTGMTLQWGEGREPFGFYRLHRRTILPCTKLEKSLRTSFTRVMCSLLSADQWGVDENFGGVLR